MNVHTVHGLVFAIERVFMHECVCARMLPVLACVCMCVYVFVCLSVCVVYGATVNTRLYVVHTICSDEHVVIELNINHLILEIEY